MDITLHLHIQPGAKKTEWVGKHGDRIKLRLAAPPVDGKANQTLIEFLADYFQVKQKDIVITHGLNSRQKTVVVHNTSIVLKL